MIGVRPFFRELGVSLGMIDTREQDRRHARAAKMEALQKVICSASVFDGLTRDGGWQEWQIQAKAMLDTKTRQLMNATPAEFVALQAAVRGMQELLDIVPNAQAKADRAKLEWDKLSEDTRE